MSPADADRLVALIAGRATTHDAPGEAHWQRVVELALRDDLAAILFARIVDSGVPAPPATIQALRDARLAGTAQSMRLFHELKVILAALRTAGVPVIPLKGAHLAATIYEDVALRQMTDIDLWIPRCQLDAARAAMRSLGYAAQSKPDRPLALQEALAGETQMFKDGATLVELHWNIFPGEWVRHTTHIDEREIWDRATPLDGDSLRQLSPEDAIIHLCVHLAVNHQMSGIGLRTLVDLDCARRKWTIDWNVVAQRAQAWRVSAATWIVLNALAKLFGDPERQLPLRELVPSALRQSILKRFASPSMIANGLDLSRGPRRFPFLMALVDRPVDAIHLAWRALFPDRLWLTLRYDSADASPWRIWQLRMGHLLNIAVRREV